MKRSVKKQKMKKNNGTSVYSGKALHGRKAILASEAIDYLRSLGHLVSNKAFILTMLVFVIITLGGVFVSAIPPTITNIQPANLTINTTSQVNFSANLTDDVGLTNSTLNILNTSDNTLIQSVVNYVSGEISVIQSWLVTLADGVYKWWISVFDDEGNENLFLVVNSSTICYQETANISTSCGGVSTGDYINGFEDGNWFDGNDSTFSSNGGFSTIDSYINYTIPNLASSNSMWSTIVGGDFYNFTFENNGCWGGSKLQLRISQGGLGIVTYIACLNVNTTWMNLQTINNGLVYEEKMYWNISTLISGNYTLTSNVFRGHWFVNQTYKDWYPISECINESQDWQKIIYQYDYNNYGNYTPEYFYINGTLACTGVYPGMFTLDLESRTTMVILGFLFIFVILFLWFRKFIFAGGLLVIIGFLLLFNGFSTIVSLVIILGGILAFFLK